MRGASSAEVAVVAGTIVVAAIAGFRLFGEKVAGATEQQGACIGALDASCGGAGGARAAAAAAGTREPSSSFGRYLAERFRSGGRREGSFGPSWQVAQAGGTATDAPATGAPATRPDNPGESGDWDGFLARRTAALADMRTELARVEAELREMNDRARSPSPADVARLAELERRQLVLQTNMATTTPDFLASSGRFEPGDLEAYQRERAIDAARLGRAANGRPPLSPDQERAEYDRATAALPDRVRIAELRQAAAEYRTARASQVTGEALRRRFPGRTGEILAEADATGLLSGVLAPRAGRLRDAAAVTARRIAITAHEIARPAAAASRLAAAQRSAEQDPPAVRAEVARLSQLSPEQLANLRQLGTGSMAFVRVNDEGTMVVKTIRTRGTWWDAEVTLSPQDRRAIAEQTFEGNRWLAAQGFPVPPTSIHPTEARLFQPMASGVSRNQLGAEQRVVAEREAADMIARARAAASADARAGGPARIVDPELSNFRFDPATGRVTSWYDPLVPNLRAPELEGAYAQLGTRGRAHVERLERSTHGGAPSTAVEGAPPSPAAGERVAAAAREVAGRAAPPPVAPPPAAPPPRAPAVERMNDGVRAMFEAGPNRWVATGNRPEGVLVQRGLTGDYSTGMGGVREARGTIEGTWEGRQTVSMFRPGDNVPTVTRETTSLYNDPLAVQARVPREALGAGRGSAEALTSRGIRPEEVVRVGAHIPRGVSDERRAQWARNYLQLQEELGLVPAPNSRGARFTQELREAFARGRYVEDDSQWPPVRRLENADEVDRAVSHVLSRYE